MSQGMVTHVGAVLGELLGYGEPDAILLRSASDDGKLAGEDLFLNHAD